MVRSGHSTTPAVKMSVPQNCPFSVHLRKYFSDNLISYSDWHQTKGFTTFGYLESPQLMVWKSDFLTGSIRFVRVPPYESGVKLTNFTFSWQNGEFLWDQKCSPHFLNQNEELSKKIGACICIYTRVYANTWQGGLIEPPTTLKRVNARRAQIRFSLMVVKKFIAQNGASRVFFTLSFQKE